MCDNLFNPDAYYQQGGDVVRGGGLGYTCDPNAKMGGRISEMVLKGKPVEPSKKYKVAGWAPVSEEAKQAGGEPIWDLMAKHLRERRVVKPLALNLPPLQGLACNPVIASPTSLPAVPPPASGPPPLPDTPPASPPPRLAACFVARARREVPLAQYWDPWKHMFGRLWPGAGSPCGCLWAASMR